MIFKRIHSLVTNLHSDITMAIETHPHNCLENGFRRPMAQDSLLNAPIIVETFPYGIFCQTVSMYSYTNQPLL